MPERNLKKPKLIYMITKANWGGAQKYVYQLATSPMIRKQFDIEVVSGSYGELLTRLESKGVRVTSVLQKNSTNPFAAILELKRMVKFLRERKPDIIHLNSSKMGLFGAIAGRIAGVPYVVFTAHGWTFNEKRVLHTRIIFRILFLVLVYSTSVTIAVSEHVKRSLRAPAFIRKKMKVIYNGIDNCHIPSLPKLSNGSNTRHIVSIGELHPNKGQDTVLPILQYIDNIHYHIIGDGEMRARIEKIIEKKNLQQKVTLYGHIQDASRLLPQYDLFLLPSRTDALPYVALEALCAGLPIIARNVGGIPEMLNGLPSTRLYEDDSDLLELLKEPLDGLANWNDTRFKEETMIKKTVIIYEKLLEKDSREKKKGFSL